MSYVKYYVTDNFLSVMENTKIGNDKELIQSNPTFQPQSCLYPMDLAMENSIYE